MSARAGDGDRGGAVSSPTACAECLARAWLLGRLAGHLEVDRHRLAALLDLGDDDLLDAVAGGERTAIESERLAFDPDDYRTRCAVAGVELICRCDAAYPAALWSLKAEPAVLHVAGGLRRFLELVAADCVALVGARRASPYAMENARSLGRGLASSGMTVISGMAAGVDAAAHQGALEASGSTVAVLPCAPQRSHPMANRRLHQHIVTAGAVVSELGPDVGVRRWMFPARNRIVAALSLMTVLVAARQGSGSMDTALQALGLKREVGAVPGQVTAPLSFGPHVLLKTGAHLIAEPLDVLTALWGAEAERRPAAPRTLGPVLGPLLEAIADGFELSEAFAQAGLDTGRGLAALGELELGGWVRRGAGGRYTIVP
jgi:DNA processing protein